MDLIIKNKLIKPSIVKLLEQIRKERNSEILKDIKDRGDNVTCTCPFHKDGRERHPSFNVFQGESKEIEYGYSHCFTCGYKAPLPKFIGDCLSLNEEDSNDWLCERFGNVFIEEVELLPEINITPRMKKQYLDESILDKYKHYHPYLERRNISKEIIDKFQIGFDKERNCVIFPVRDEHNNLVMLTTRSIEGKSFHLQEKIEKPVYLLNNAISEKISTVIVVESQINALTCYSYGFPAIALFGLGTTHQYDVLNKCPIRNYILMFDGDEAGRRGAMRFMKNIRKDVFVTDIQMYPGKDVNDLSKEEFMQLLKSNSVI